MLLDGCSSHGAERGTFAGGDEADRLRAALPAFAGGVFSRAKATRPRKLPRSPGRAPAVSSIGARPGDARRRVAARKKPWRRSRAWDGNPLVPALDRARLLGELAIRPTGTRLRGDELDGAAAGCTHLRRQGWPISPAHPASAACTPRACVGSVHALVFAEPVHARRPEKRTLVRAMKGSARRWTAARAR